MLFSMTQAYPFDLVWKVEHEGPVDGDHREAHQRRPHGAIEHDRKELAIPPTDWRCPYITYTCSEGQNHSNEIHW